MRLDGGRLGGFDWLIGELDERADGPEVHWNTARANPSTSLQCEGQDSNLHALRTLEPKSSASANSATLAYGVISNG